MKIQFLDASETPGTGIIVRPVNQDAVPAELEAVLVEGARQSRFTGKSGQLFEGFVERDGKVQRVALVGLGKADADERTSFAEQAGAAVAAKYLTSGETALAVDLKGSGLDAGDTAAFLLGARLRTWRFDAYRTKLGEDKKPSLSEIAVIGAPEGVAAEWAVEEAVAIGAEFTRELVTEPANVIYPGSFVERCRARMEGTGLEIRALGEAEMRELGMGSLLGVAQGSERAPSLLVMEWKGGEAGAKPIAFVGKGVTFDTGGISLKPPAGMEDMKWDMGGAGAVAGTMLTLALRKAKANVIGVCGLVENMPDGKAQRPGDVVTSMSGQTIEVINTDAEGRLVLCDALTWVQREYTPTRIVDLATLTGAIIGSLAHEYAGLFSNNDALAADLAAAGEATNEKLWRFPMGPAYDKQLDSPIADMKNVGSRFGGSITAAQFLKRFIENDTPWAHLDIAGTVWADKPGATWDKGATGFGVRLLDRFVRDTIES
ncbi:leucyl aminopeptidase [Novosphingobium sp. RD2P27]|uniref:Probable cytosol aminopeptidase n=1 Tax=Novosphingobium kalidii TaxID=3230299 RepID=A0ABV2CYG9_9SPHN